MTTKTRAIIAACAAVALVAIASCRSRRAEAFAVPDGERMALAHAAELLAADYTPWSDIYCPVTLGIEAPEPQSASGRCTMVRDSLIHISLRAMGTEVAVAHITSDSVWIIDKYHKAYAAEPLSALLGGYPLALSQIQDLMLGQAFMPDSSLAPLAPAIVSRSSRPVLLATELTAPNGNSVTLAYADTASTAAGPAAANISAWAVLQGTGLGASMQWKWRDAKWDTGRRPQFRAPKADYRRLTFSDLAY